MEIFADTANLEELKELLSWGVIDGCTTNPKIVVTEGADFETRMKEILALVSGPVSIEVTSNDIEPMISEGKEFSQWGKNVVVKLPMSINGLKALQELKRHGIKTNVTGCMTYPQLIMAAKAGATYASLFYSRVGDNGANPREVLQKSVRFFTEQKMQTKIIVGSIRAADQISDIFEAGAHVVTVPPQFFKILVKNLKSDEAIEEFLHFWTSKKK